MGKIGNFVRSNNTKHTIQVHERGLFQKLFSCAILRSDTLQGEFPYRLHVTSQGKVHR